MKKEVADKWVEALNSDRYKQASGALKQVNGQGYCCLGVLCELYMETTNQAVWKTGSDPKILYFTTSDESEAEILPAVVKEWAGMSSSSGEFSNELQEEINTPYDSLAEMNDSGVNFKKIAQEIYYHYEEL